jgi:hypothetical protein
MRWSVACCGLLLVVGIAWADAPQKSKPSSERYGIAVDPQAYPQASARAAFVSVLKAIDTGKFDYLLAQLTDPAFIDERVGRLHGGKFEEQVAETKAKLDAAAVKQLHRYQDKGEWSEDGGKAVLSLKDVPERVVHLKKIGNRWYLENKYRPTK